MKNTSYNAIIISEIKHENTDYIIITSSSENYSPIIILVTINSE